MPISSAKQITTFYHCAQCVAEKPPDISPKDWARLEIGATPIGIQAWCSRHEVNVFHVDFQGQRHPANLGAAMPS